MNDIGELIRRYREKNGLTQKELASRLKLSASTIGMYEQNRRTPDLDTLRELAKIFDIPASIFLGVSPQTPVMHCSDMTGRILDLASRSPKSLSSLKPLLKTEILSGYCTNLDNLLDDVYVISDFFGTTDEYILGGRSEERKTYEGLSLSHDEEKLLNTFRLLNEDNRDIAIGDIKKLLKDQVSEGTLLIPGNKKAK